MSDWQDKSDFDINKAVTKLKNLKIASNQPGKVGIVVQNTLSGDWVTFNPCNNPSDAWPIIVESQISIFNYDNDLWSAQKWIGNKRIANEFIRGGNVLRAAMIVYLEINGVKP